MAHGNPAAIVQDDRGHPVTKRAGINSGQRLGVRFSDGELDVRAE